MKIKHGTLKYLGLKTTLCGLILLTVLGFIGTDGALAANQFVDYERWAEKTITDPFHSWTIVFSKDVNAESVNPYSIYVENSLGQNLFLLSQVSEKQISLTAPTGGYQAGEYCLYIEPGLQSSGGELLANPIKMKFNVTPAQQEQTDQIRIELAWADTSLDLDSYLTGPGRDGQEFCVYFFTKQYPDAKDLTGGETPDVQLEASAEPTLEITSINTQLAGAYIFYVYDYTNGEETSSFALSASQARVSVYRGNTLLEEFYVPAGQEGTLWKVFEISGENITPVNTLSKDLPPCSQD